MLKLKKYENLGVLNVESVIPWFVLFNKDTNNPYDHGFRFYSSVYGHDLKLKETTIIYKLMKLFKSN